MVNWKVTATFTEPLLGSVPKNREIYSRFIEEQKQRRIDAQSDVEIDTLPIDETAGVTGFHADELGIFLYDYAIEIGPLAA